MKTLTRKGQTERTTQSAGPSTLLHVAMAVVFALLASANAVSAKQLFTDSAITAAIVSDLHFEMTVFPNFLDVGTQHGIVTLSGSVNDILAKRRAVEIAEGVRGVLGVIDRITVKPESRPDEAIRKDILMALLNDPATEAYKVSVSVNGAVVTLTGTVGSKAESQLAQQVAESVRGVNDIHNELVINYAGTRTDREIAADIQAVLHWDIRVTGYPIQVAVREGHVTLTGTVGSVVEKSRVASDAWVNGVLSVDDSGMKVEPTARELKRRRNENAGQPDTEIKNALQTSLRADPRVSHYADMINVTVEDGVAILEGAVGDSKAKSAAGVDARDIVGVSWVDNELSVRPTENLPDDTDTQKGLNAALHWDPLLEGTRIDAAVFGHIAFLNGSVDSVEQRAEAQDDALRTRGVVEVRNHLKVVPEPDFFFYNQAYYDFEMFGPPYDLETLRPLPPKSDAQIKKDIEHALFWSPFVHRDDITVTVRHGVAKLTGTVGTWIGYGEAEQDARKGGALEVINRLKVS